MAQSSVSKSSRVHAAERSPQGYSSFQKRFLDSTVWDSTFPGPPDLHRVGARTCDIQKRAFWDPQAPP